ncbi:hypothetical protein GDO78_017471 [Eleutherodactylus coqui]|uniref:Uncharacterized protein n=1 Tax=Eleutherodactylus coqui TaxID=57060 RepID=A0A8J6C7V3_ELECQ|nr:hypothetical protein GDO78_017471 [Eleutherodactylus coqui]
MEPNQKVNVMIGSLELLQITKVFYYRNASKTKSTQVVSSQKYDPLPPNKEKNKNKYPSLTLLAYCYKREGHTRSSPSL